MMIKAATVTLLLLGAVLGTDPPSRAGEPLPAPLQIDAVEQVLSDRTGLEVPLVVVDLGAAKDRKVPARADVARMTVLGTTGASVASLHDVRKVCDFLCGDELEECHYVARVSLARPLDEVGTPVAAFVGDREISAFQPAESDATETPINPGADFAEVFVRPVWPDDPASAAAYRLDEPEAADRELRIEYRWPGGEVYSMEDRECSLRRRGRLGELSCSAFAMVLLGERPLLVSFPDYNDPAAEVVASFESGGMRYHVVRLGLKAQTVFGLLYERDGGWHALIRPRDYALLC
ncbi:MAG: hypothetical protein OEQ13_03025 [Acidobacteriota bacterium]|nr:hypothetical protein [Acidobacteriota bacterium]